jgi:hypothetical protein
VVSTYRSSPPIVADELRRQADDFIELADLTPKIARRARNIENRPAPEPANEADDEPDDEPDDGPGPEPGMEDPDSYHENA